jgi:hypothetical protein
VGELLVRSRGAEDGVRDFLRLYHLEAYLFGEVTQRFQQDGTLNAFDFFCIVIWKANRAKSKVATRMRTKGYADLATAVDALLRGVSGAPDNRSRLRVLVEEWGFRLSMASALLSVLYPEDFTVYDVRVCDMLGDFKDAQYRTQFGALWGRYSGYVEAVRAAVPDHSTLREKDRFLWGKSFAEQLERDVSAGFRRPAEEEELEG